MSSSITNCYSIGQSDYGLVSADPGTTTECFWDTEASGTETSEAGVGHVTSWMQTQGNYEAAGWDFDTIWEIL